MSLVPREASGRGSVGITHEREVILQVGDNILQEQKRVKPGAQSWCDPQGRQQQNWIWEPAMKAGSKRHGIENSRI